MAKIRRYKSLTVDRVDLVDRGANFDRATGDGSHILLVKRDADGSTEKQDLACPSCSARLSTGYGERGATVPNYCPECGAKLAIRATSKQELTMPSTADQTDVNKRIADLEALVAKQAADNAAAIAKAVEDAKAEAEAKAAADRAAVEKRANDLEAEVKKAQALAEAEVEKREVAQAVAKASELALVLKADTDGPLMYRIGKALVAEDAARITEILTGANEQIRLGKLFAEVGRTGVPPTGDAGGNPEQQLFAKAEELRTANPKLSREDAVLEARAQFPDLRRKYEDWKSAQINPVAAR